jgi:hypothetical protein
MTESRYKKEKCGRGEAIDTPGGILPAITILAPLVPEMVRFRSVDAHLRPLPWISTLQLPAEGGGLLCPVRHDLPADNGESLRGGAGLRVPMENAAGEEASASAAAAFAFVFRGLPIW